MNKFYLTTAIPYVNAKPHVGHALEFVQADAIARFKRLLGNDTLLLSGSDENSLKNVQAAEAEQIPVQQLVDKNSDLFIKLAEKLNIQFDVFERGSSSKHILSSQKLWELCDKAGDIYKKEYTGLYCVGCELFYEKEELNKNIECFEHPGKPLEEVTEVNYFFKLSKYQKQILQLLEDNKLEITPQSRRNEAIAFVKQGLSDISISRSNNRAKGWGVPVPGDDTQIMYVWFDALNIYQSGLGFDWNQKMYQKWWPANLHVIGKGILRFHAVYWPAFLLSAKLALPKALFVHGYFTVDGQKMSKSLGNVIDPIELVNNYGVDAIRYYMLREIPPTGDGDFSETRLKQLYNSDLANGLGNLVARVAKLAEKIGLTTENKVTTFSEEVLKKTENYLFNETLAAVWFSISEVDKKINQEEPWKMSDNQLKKALEAYLLSIQQIAFDLKPFLPETSDKILRQFSGRIQSQPSLFPRI